MTLTLTILGCGSSAGVPRPALGWGKCDPANPKNRRRRCSLLVERTTHAGTTRIVIDTAPDFRQAPLRLHHLLGAAGQIGNPVKPIPPARALQLVHHAPQILHLLRAR